MSDVSWTIEWWPSDSMYHWVVREVGVHRVVGTAWTERGARRQVDRCLKRWDKDFHSQRPIIIAEGEG